MYNLFHQPSTDFEPFKEKRLVFQDAAKKAPAPAPEKQPENKEAPKTPKEAKGLGDIAYKGGLKGLKGLEGRPRLGRPETKKQRDERIAKEKIQKLFGSMDTGIFTPTKSEPEAPKELTPAERKKQEKAEKAEALKLQQEEEADEVKESAEGLSHDVEQVMEGITTTRTTIEDTLKEFNKILESGEYDVSDKAMNIAKQALKVRDSVRNADFNKANRSLNKANNLLAQAESTYDSEKFVKAKGLYAKAAKQFEAAQGLFSKVQDTYKESEDLMASAVKEAKSPPATVARRGAELTPDKWKEAIEQKARDLQIKLIGVKTVKMSSGGGGSEFSVGSVQNIDRFKVGHATKEVTQEDVQFLTQNLMYSANTIKKEMGQLELNKISGVLIAMRKIGLEDRAQRLANHLNQAADEWKEGGNGRLVLQKALDPYMDVSGARYAKGPGR